MLRASERLILFNNDKVRDAISRGYTAISPLIEFDASLERGRIINLALVPNPAMTQTDLNITRFAFSAPEVSQMTEGTNNTQNTGQQSEKSVTVQGHEIPANILVNPPAEPQAPVAPAASIDATVMATLAEAITKNIVSSFMPQIESLQQEITALKSGSTGVTTPPAAPDIPANDTKIPDAQIPGVPNEWIEQLSQLKAENQKFKDQADKDEQKSYTNKLAELRSLGQDNPEKLVAHLKDTKAKIETLDSFKVAILKNSSMNSNQTPPLGVEGGKNSGKEPLSIEKLVTPLKMTNIPPDELKWLSERMRIPIN